MLKCIAFQVTDSYYAELKPRENGMKGELAAAGITLMIEKAADRGEAAFFFFGKETDPEELLVITDSPRLFERFRTEGFYVIALYHEGNRQEHFEGALYAVEDVDQLALRSYEEVYQRLAGLPWEILETDRLRVRESSLSDVGEFYRIYADPSITYYMEDLFREPEKERAYMEIYIKQVYGFYGFGMWTVLHKEENRVIGRAGLSVREGYDLPELGFMIDAAYQHRGYAYEVCTAILEYAKTELSFDRVQALVQENNSVSRHLLQKLGFRYEKEVRESGSSLLLYTVTLPGAGKTPEQEIK